MQRVGLKEDSIWRTWMNCLMNKSVGKTSGTPHCKMVGDERTTLNKNGISFSQVVDILLKYLFQGGDYKEAVYSIAHLLLIYCSYIALIIIKVNSFLP
jgi:hypothetical protein